MPCRGWRSSMWRRMARKAIPRRLTWMLPARPWGRARWSLRCEAGSAKSTTEPARFICAPTPATWLAMSRPRMSFAPWFDLNLAETSEDRRHEAPGQAALHKHGLACFGASRLGANPSPQDCLSPGWDGGGAGTDSHRGGGGRSQIEPAHRNGGRTRSLGSGGVGLGPALSIYLHHSRGDCPPKISLGGARERRRSGRGNRVPGRFHRVGCGKTQSHYRVEDRNRRAHANGSESKTTIASDG